MAFTIRIKASCPQFGDVEQRCRQQQLNISL
jgi:hypothetical protein